MSNLPEFRPVPPQVVTDYAEGRRLYENREAEPMDWADWADENAMLLIEQCEQLRAENRRLRCPFRETMGPLEHRANGCCS